MNQTNHEDSTSKTNNLFTDLNDPLEYNDIHSFVILKGIKTSFEFPYVRLGKPVEDKGWIIEISTILPKVKEIIPNVIKYLLTNYITFQMPENKDLYSKILFGHFGTDIQNRLLIIYPDSEGQAIKIVKDLQNFTTKNRYPFIQGSYHLSHGIHVRFDYTKCINVSGSDGNKQRVAILKNGEALANPMTLVYKHPKEIKWIYSEIKPYVENQLNTVVGKKSVRTRLIRLDSKGMVYHGLYFRKWYLPKQCIIKTGRKNELYSHSGTDAASSISWQYKVHTILKESEVTALPYDLVEDELETSMVMEKLKGISLSELVFSLHNIGGWKSLNYTTKKEIFELVVGFLLLINKIHTYQIVHRDISPSNILYTKSKELKIIDFGLSYQLSNEKTNPFYGGITIGYSDPYHKIDDLPDILEDTFSIGGMLIYFFCGLNPALLDIEHIERLTVQLNSMVGSEIISSIICSCVQPNRESRPTSEEILAFIKQNAENILNNNSKTSTLEVSELTHAIINGTQSFFSSIYVSNDQLWVYSTPDESREKHPDDRMNTIPGIYTGVAGTILTYLSINESYPIYHTNKAHNEILIKNLDYLVDSYGSNDIREVGLLTGKFGIGVTLAKCIKKGILEKSKRLIENTSQLLKLNVDGLGLWDGISGKGVFIINSYEALNIHEYKHLLREINTKIINSQKNSGSWLVEKKHISNTTLNIASGDAGIVYYLLIYTYATNDDSFEGSICRCLNNIMECNISAIRDHSLMFGLSGIAYIFLKAYEKFRIEKYRSFAENILSKINIDKVRENISLATGISGIGYVYSIAAKLLQNAEYLKKTLEIATYLYNLHLTNAQELFWYSDVNRKSNAGLFKGNAGILLFFKQCIEPDLSDPLF